LKPKESLSVPVEITLDAENDEQKLYWSLKRSGASSPDITKCEITEMKAYPQKNCIYLKLKSTGTCFSRACNRYIWPVETADGKAEYYKLLRTVMMITGTGTQTKYGKAIVRPGVFQMSHTHEGQTYRVVEIEDKVTFTIEGGTITGVIQQINNDAKKYTLYRNDIEQNDINKNIFRECKRPSIGERVEVKKYPATLLGVSPDNPNTMAKIEWGEEYCKKHNIKPRERCGWYHSSNIHRSKNQKTNEEHLRWNRHPKECRECTYEIQFSQLDSIEIVEFADFRPHISAAVRTIMNEHGIRG